MTATAGSGAPRGARSGASAAAVSRRPRLPRLRAPAPGPTRTPLGSAHGRAVCAGAIRPISTTVPRIVVLDAELGEARAFLERLRPDLVDRALQGHPEAGHLRAPARGHVRAASGHLPRIPQRARLLLGAGQSRSRSRRHDAAARRRRRRHRPRLPARARCDFDEVRESHIVIQHRAVVENLDAIGRILTASAAATTCARSLRTDGVRPSGASRA